MAAKLMSASGRGAWLGVWFLFGASGAAAHGDHGHSHDHDHSHGHSHSHGYSDESAQNYAEMLGMGFVPFPLVAMVTIMATKVGFGLAPRYFRTNPRLLSVANAYSAGIFLAGGLSHLLPEASHAFAMLSSEGWHFPENMAFVFCGAGFMATLCIEKLLFMSDHADKDKDSDSEEMADFKAGHGHGNGHGEHGHCHTHGIVFSDPNASVLPFLLTAVLCFHSFIGGMALGIQSSMSKAFIIFIAIISHKWVEAFSLGISFVRANTSYNMMLKFILGFASSSPVGIAAGWMLRASVTSHANVLVAALDAVASGTFIYIAAVDLIAEEFQTSMDKFSKFAALCGGFMTLVLLSWATPHEH